MFDNLEPNQNNSPISQVPPGPANPLRPSASPSFPPSAKAEDIFAGVKEVAAPSSKNGSPAPLTVANRPSSGGGLMLKLLIIIIIVLILAIAGLVIASQYFGFTGLSQFLPKKEEVNVPAPAAENKKEVAPTPAKVETSKKEEVPPKDNGAPAGLPDENLGNVSTSSVPKNDEVKSEELNDADGDGLTDAKEKTLGTNLNKPDTDGDGLTDGEEVNALKISPLKVDTDNDELSDFAETKTYFTNPNNPDTDADTFLDGKEVQGGYNPKGPGKLSEVK